MFPMSGSPVQNVQGVDSALETLHSSHLELFRDIYIPRSGRVLKHTGGGSPNASALKFARSGDRALQALHECALGFSPVTSYSGVKMLVPVTEEIQAQLGFMHAEDL